jgi:hypothetical protein
LILAWINFYRAYKRTLTRTQQAKDVVPYHQRNRSVVGAFPFLLYSSNFAASRTLLFGYYDNCYRRSGNVHLSNGLRVAFFGVPWRIACEKPFSMDVAWTDYRQPSPWVNDDCQARQ